MANLDRYRGTNSLPGVRRPQVQADTAVGRALAGVGAQIQGAARDVGALAQRAQMRQNQIDDVQREKGLLDFSANVANRELEATQDLAPGASGYTEKMLAQFDKDAEGFTASMPESVREQAKLDVQRLRTQYHTRFAKTELGERNRFFQQNIVEGTDQLAKTIKSNPGSFDEAKAAGRRLIEATGLGQIEKEAAIRKWDRMASIAWVETLPATERKNLFAGASVDAGSLVRAKEGFRNTAYWDVNHYRVGYGSDTVTKADGTVVKVTKDTVITRADAERDLTRRLAEFQGLAVKAVGAGAWSALPPRAQAALTSITYNYGELPGRLHEAVKSGDLETIATAIENLGGDNGGVNRKRRQEEADIVRGVRRIPNAPPEVQARLDALAYDDQVKLSDQAERDMISVAGARKDAFALDIAKDPLAVDRQQIIDDPVIDDGQKATLLNSLNAALKAGEDDRLAIAWAQGEGKGNPLSSDDRKASERVYDQLTAVGGEPDAVALNITERKGVIPKPYADDVRAGLFSADPATVERSFERSLRLFELDPDAVRGAENGEAIEKAALRWRVYREAMGLPADQAAKRIAASNTPEGMAQREAVLKSEAVKQRLKEITPDHVENMFDPGWTSIGPKLGANEAGQAVAVEEFKTLFREAVGETGGYLEAAEQIAFASLARVWSTSEFSPLGEKVVLKYTPERLYPAVDGGHEYLRKQAEEVLAAEGVKARRLYLVGNPEYTIQDYRAGRPPRLTLQYVDEQGIRQQLGAAFYADIERARVEAKEAKAADWAKYGDRYTEEQQAAEERRALGDASRPSNMPGGAPLDGMRKAVDEFNALENAENAVGQEQPGQQ